MKVRGPELQGGSTCGGKMKSPKCMGGKPFGPYAASSRDNKSGNPTKGIRENLAQFKPIRPKPTPTRSNISIARAPQPVHSDLTHTRANVPVVSLLHQTSLVHLGVLQPQHTPSTSQCRSGTCLQPEQPVISLQDLIGMCGEENAYNMLLQHMGPEEINGLRSALHCQSVPVQGQREAADDPFTSQHNYQPSASVPVQPLERNPVPNFDAQPIRGASIRQMMACPRPPCVQHAAFPLRPSSRSAVNYQHIPIQESPQCSLVKEIDAARVELAKIKAHMPSSEGDRRSGNILSVVTIIIFIAVFSCSVFTSDCVSVCLQHKLKK